MKKIGIAQFPGSNCDEDVFKALKGLSPEILPSYQFVDKKKI